MDMSCLICGGEGCATCKKIEAYADEAIHQGFGDQLAAGSLAWQVINLDEPENRHFIDDFELVTKTVVLAEYEGGAIVRWQKLDKVWQLVRSEDDFSDYIRAETAAFLEQR